MEKKVLEDHQTVERPRNSAHSRLVGNCLVYVYQFLTPNCNFKTISNLQNFLFHKFHLSFDKNNLSQTIPINHQKNLHKNPKRIY